MNTCLKPQFMTADSVRCPFNLHGANQTGLKLCAKCPHRRWEMPDYSGPVRGLGDVVARVTKAVGIHPCPNCLHNQRVFNELLPIGHQT